MRRSLDRLTSTMGFPMRVRWHISIETAPGFHQECSAHLWGHTLDWDTCILQSHPNHPDDPRAAVVHFRNQNAVVYSLVRFFKKLLVTLIESLNVKTWTDRSRTLVNNNEFSQYDSIYNFIIFEICISPNDISQLFDSTTVSNCVNESRSGPTTWWLLTL